METYFDALPEELLFIIIEILDNKYQINNLISSSNKLTIYFSRDMNWKKMFYINYKDVKTIINKLHTWRDNYSDNLNIKDRYNLEVINIDMKNIDYIVFLKNITTEISELPNDMDLFEDSINNYGGTEGDRVAYIMNNQGNMITNPDDNEKSKYIVDYISNKLNIKRSSIGFHIDNINIYGYVDIMNDFNYQNEPDDNNLIKFEIEGIKVLLIDAPDL